MNKPINILIVSPFFIYPANHGGKIDVLNNILQIKDTNLNVLVDLLYCGLKPKDKEDIQRVKKLCNIKEIKFIQIKTRSFIERLFGILSPNPEFAKIYKKLKYVKFNNIYDTVIIHGLHVDSILENKSLKTSQFILRVHNDEFVYEWKKISLKNNFLKKLYAIWDAYKIKLRQFNTFKKVDRLLFISNSEYLKFNRVFNNKSLFLPTYFFDFQNLSFFEYENRGDTVLFIGSLGIGFNIIALKWYLDNIHNELKRSRPRYQLIIAGNTWDTDISWIQKYVSNDSQTKLYCNLDDLSILYKRSRVFVNPMQVGAGLKIKTIDAILHGLPVVSTSVGVEGSGLVDQVNCLIADNKDDFIMSLMNLLDNKVFAYSISQNAQEYIKNRYCNVNVVKALLEEVK